MLIYAFLSLGLAHLLLAGNNGVAEVYTLLSARQLVAASVVRCMAAVAGDGSQRGIDDREARLRSIFPIVRSHRQERRRSSAGSGRAGTSTGSRLAKTIPWRAADGAADTATRRRQRVVAPERRRTRHHG